MAIRRVWDLLTGRESMANSRDADRMLRAFGERLRACRVAAGIESAEGMADLLGIEGQRYRKYERGAAMPPIDLLAEIAHQLDASLDFLLRGVSPRRHTPPRDES